MCSCIIQECPKRIDQQGEIPQGMVNPLQQTDCWQVAQLD